MVSLSSLQAMALVTASLLWLLSVQMEELAPVVELAAVVSDVAVVCEAVAASLRPPLQDSVVDAVSARLALHRETCGPVESTIQAGLLCSEPFEDPLLSEEAVAAAVYCWSSCPAWVVPASSLVTLGL